MTATVHVLHQCCCGAPGIRRFVLANGKPIGEAIVCDRCMEDVNSGIVRNFKIDLEFNHGRPSL